MKTIFSFVLVVAILALVPCKYAQAITETTTNGSACQGTTSNDRAQITYNGFGTNNTGTTTISVLCPLTKAQTQDAPDPILEVDMPAYDRNCSTNVVATLYLTSSDNNTVLYTAVRQTSGCMGPVNNLGWVIDPAIDAFQGYILVSVPPNQGNGFSAIVNFRTTVAF